MSHSLQSITALISQVEKSVIGQSHVIRALVIGLLTKGHVLLEGLPGTAKTRSVKSLADAMNASFGRVQFTPDLLPSDITGTVQYQDNNGSPLLTFQQGPLFHNLVLADEINRAPAKVQAALLEAMAEGTVTVGDTTHQLDELFMVLATQNPVEQEGTYPLPEAQMDRFMMKINVDYPDDEAELNIIRLVRAEENAPVMNAGSAVSKIDPLVFLSARQQLSTLSVSDIVERYIVALVMATRHPERYPDSPLSAWIKTGSSPRASIALDKCARAEAWLSGRDHVLPDDVRSIAHSVLSHRITLSYDALADNIDGQAVVNELLDIVAVG
ncbi:MoxR family ATPase [Shewanella electrodiphila]|uniref:MoxR family ATPase n=1 Tax=Shewanella electrodiphila TaxID=934143 RepID=A0ABT0KJD3_9GAMM|nr:MoxR family ATPase [Shewanella electrodiphila]MCL1043853.1 MoxR family ATPase [Shewanella electrodiphila]